MRKTFSFAAAGLSAGVLTFGIGQGAASFAAEAEDARSGASFGSGEGADK